MKTINTDKVFAIVAAVLERNTQYFSIELARGILATVQFEVAKEAVDVVDTNPDTTAEP